MYQYKFRLDYPNVQLDVAKYHIQCPEHIRTVHQVGAPLFSIKNVYEPKTARDMTSINFDCETLGNKFKVFMYSKNDLHSELVFSKDQGTSSNAYLRLTFNIEGYDDNSSHVLLVTFAFWNAWLRLLVPLFPVFVFINGIEDKLFLQKMVNGENVDFDEHPMFALYRLYIFLNQLERTAVAATPFQRNTTS